MQKETDLNKKTQQNKRQEENTHLIELKNKIKEITTQINTLLASQQLAETDQEKQIETKIVQLIRLETQFHNIKQLIQEEQNSQNIKGQSDPTEKPQLLKKDNQSFNAKIKEIILESLTYQPTKEDIQQRRNAFNQQYADNEDGWTDATQSNVGTEDLNNQLMVFDDDMLDQMGINGEDNDPSNQESSSEQSQVDFEELEGEFVKGKPSNEHFCWGQHKDKFCVSVVADFKKGYVASGGGDDNLFLYHLKQDREQSSNKNKQKNTSQIKEQLKKPSQNQIIGDQTNEDNKIQQKEINMIKSFKQITHKQTVKQLELSWDKQFLFSLTDKELLCTNVKDFQTLPVPIDPLPENLACHKFGGVFAASNGYNVEVFNIKGFKYYDSFCLDEQVNILKWSNDGKQLFAACDNKLRIITMKTRDVIKCSGKEFHQGEITAMAVTDGTIFTGCIDGYVYATNISKGNILGGTPKMQATANVLASADNYLLVGPSVNALYWYDSNKLKRLFQNQLKGSPTDIIQVRNKNEFAIGDIQGQIHIFDKRTPLEAKLTLEAGNTVHQLYFDLEEGNTLLAGCEDGCVRGWDLRKFN